jgi:hypothetical protein
VSRLDPDHARRRSSRARELNQALIKSAEKPAKKRPTATADAKKTSKKTATPKRLKKRFKVDGLVKRDGNRFDHTRRCTMC